ncbi:MAG: hypothetical protein K0S45_157 [Nitrospira sp.]|jgi:hypothetical protein|nr:hypothetical protein [Nitrospira sp.]
MKKAKQSGMRREYQRSDLGKGVRGKYYQSYCSGANLVLLSPDVAAAFPTDKAVNDTLRSLIDVARRSTSRTKRVGRTKQSR